MPDPIATLLTAWLRRAGFRRGDGVDVLAAAKACSIEQKSLRRYLDGEVSPRVASLERIAEAAGWEVVIGFRRRKPPA